MLPVLLSSVTPASTAEWLSMVSSIATISMAATLCVKSIYYWRSGHLRGHQPMEEKVSPPSFYVCLLGHLVIFLLSVVHFVLFNKVRNIDDVLCPSSISVPLDSYPRSSHQIFLLGFFCSHVECVSI